MKYNDEALVSIDYIEEMAKAYNLSLKEKGFVFLNLEEEGKSLLLDEIFDILFKLRASYRFLRNFLGVNTMLELTELQIEKLRTIFDVENNRGYVVKTNQTKCFLNVISLENQLILKMLLLSQKCQECEEIVSFIVIRTKTLSKNLEIENIFSSKPF